MKNPVNEWMQRPLRYWYIDGLSEMAAGLLFVLIALLYFSVTLFPEDSSMSNWLLGIGQPALILLAGWGLRKAVNALKERVTYPRTGYVEYRQPTGNRRWPRLILLGLVSGLVAAVVALLAGRLTARLIPLLIGIILAAYLVYMTANSGVIRLYINAAFTFLIGLAVTVLNPPEELLMVCFMAAFGLLWLITGAITLVRYLGSTRPLEEGEE